MKTNISINLTDAERLILADILDGKHTQRLATRAEIVALCRQHIGGLIADLVGVSTMTGPAFNQDDIYKADPDDAELLRDKSPGYIRGWNLVKRRGHPVSRALFAGLRDNPIAITREQ